METNNDTGVKAIQLIMESGLLDPNFTVERLMDLTQNLTEQETLRAAARTDVLIHEKFILIHTEPRPKDVEPVEPVEPA
ncbi:hypothetical protein KFU94_01700 [Chloroflexi bacterium TSY]|nr:hypothetical protein [Chloroflexi bacterium TSY]